MIGQILPQNPSQIYDLERRRFGLAAYPPPQYQKDEFPQSFPYDTWSWQAMRYYRYWQQFSGAIWLEEEPEPDRDGNVVLRYPLQINNVRVVCMQRSYTLWGEVPDTEGPLVKIIAEPRRKQFAGEISDKQRQSAFELTTFLDDVLTENNARSLMQEGGLIQQALGGIVLRAGWAPDSSILEHKIKLEMIIPDFFLPIWDRSTPDVLIEAWIVYRLPIREAIDRFGFNPNNAETGGDPIYLEHWCAPTVAKPQGSLSITLAGKPITVSIDGDSITYDENAPNPFGFVPFVYIPTERGGSYYGISACDGTEGLEREINTRMADMGDVISEAAHRELFVRNVSKSGGTRDLGDNLTAIDLGMTSVNAKDPPDAFTVEPPNIPDALSSYPSSILDQFSRTSFFPKVAYGEDEGSQRSALTLAFRMMPLLGKVTAIRTNWTIGLRNLARMIVRIAILKGVGGMTDEHLADNRIRCDWAPMIPRDKEQDLNEVVMALRGNAISPTTAMEKLNLVSDPEAEYKRVQEHLMFMAKLKAETEAAKPPED